MHAAAVIAAHLVHAACVTAAATVAAQVPPTGLGPAAGPRLLLPPVHHVVLAVGGHAAGPFNGTSPVGPPTGSATAKVIASPAAEISPIAE